MQGIDSRSQANAAWMEHQILNHVKQALRVTLDWNVPSLGLSRKLSSVQFTLRSFQRHLERLMDIEEQDGYMVFVAEAKPNMHRRIEHLKLEHDRFRSTVSELVPEVDALSDLQNEEFEKLCAQISSLLERVDQHDVKEVELLQETFLLDEGGEG